VLYLTNFPKPKAQTKQRKEKKRKEKKRKEGKENSRLTHYVPFYQSPLVLPSTFFSRRKLLSATPLILIL